VGTDDPRSHKARFYSDPTHRPVVLPPDLDAIPAELRAENRWVLWRLVWKPKGRRWTKAPFRPDGRAAKSNDPTTWTTFDVAVAAYQAGGFDGIGFVLGDGFAGIDLDDVRDPGTAALTPDAAALVERFATHAEISPSGSGVKLVGRGDWRAGWHRKPFPGGGEIEGYSAGRYFTVTGRAVRSSPVVEIQAAIDELAARFVGPAAGADLTKPNLPSDDDELVRRATTATNGAKFARLWAGDTTDSGGDESRADLALCGMLAFWAGGDAARIDQLFRRSGLMRPKWDHRRGDSTYGQRTVAKALEGKTEFYTPGRGKTDPPAGDGSPAQGAAVPHPPIHEEDRRAETAFWTEFDAVRPRLLGALLDRVSAGRRELPRVELPTLPRMADFALFAVACERGSGEPERFLPAYADNQAGAHEQALDSSPLPPALLALVDGKLGWEGSPAELFTELTRHTTDPPPKDWPKKPNVLTNRLRRLTPNLRRVHCPHAGHARYASAWSTARAS
jgi:hypothetical protein